jgi:hypothetical protein
MKKLLGIVLIGGLAVSESIYGQPSKQVCLTAEIASIETTSMPAGVRRIGKTENIKIQNQTNNTALVLVQGPILGSMDSSNIKTEVSCLPDGIGLTATITRSDNFNGAVLQNVTWLPRISLSLRLLQPSIVLYTTWRIQTSSGKEVTLAQTPPFRARRFPVRVTKRIVTSNK